MTSNESSVPPRKSRAPKLNRKLHRMGALVAGLPLLVIIVSGVFLQLKKDWSTVLRFTISMRFTVTFPSSLSSMSIFAGSPDVVTNGPL